MQQGPPFATPILETARLRLRGRTPGDFAFFREMWADPAVTRYTDGKPRSEEDTWTKFLRMIGHWSVMGFGYWAVEEKESGALIGEAGFADFKRDLAPPLALAPEMGWALASFAHGKGYASEAVAAAIEWGDDFFNGARMSCIIGRDNAPSVRLAEKCGFTLAGTAVYHGEEVLVLHRG